MLLILSLPVFAQQIGQWRNYTNMGVVTDAAEDSRGIWAATSGGAFHFNTSTNSFLTLNTVSYNRVLSTVGRSSAIAIDKYGKLWLGNQDGIIDIYDPETGDYISRLLDIVNSPKNQKRINEIVFSGDTAFISTNFGISLVDADSFYFYDSFSKFGSFPQDISVRSVQFHKGITFVATENGIARQKSPGANLSDPQSWANYIIQQGLPSNNVTKLFTYRDTVIASTDKGLARFENDAWQPFVPQLNSRKVVDSYLKADTLYLALSDALLRYFNGVIQEVYVHPTGNITGIASIAGNTIYLTSTSGLLKFTSGTQAEVLIPIGPNTNNFMGITVDREGNLWSGTGTQIPPAVGVNKFDGTNWTNYNTSNIPGAIANTYFKVYAAPDNSIYMLSWGDGFTRLNSNGSFKIFNASNTPFKGIPEAENYLVIEGAASDSKGRMWFSSYGSSNASPLGVLGADDSIRVYHNDLTRQVIQTYSLLIDQNDTKWMIVSTFGQEYGQELFYFNENRTFYKDDVNGWGRVNKAMGLNSDIINAIALDRRNELWIGGSNGINILSNTSQPRSRLREIFSFSNQNINALAVDALNQKWVATNQGVYLLSPDGSKLVAHYDMENSPLPENSVNSIAIDNNSGTVYFATESGLTSLTTTAVNPRSEFSDIYVSPNPLRLRGNETATITIDGLIRDSNIKIFTVSGSLVASFASEGGRVAQWNGLDMQGRSIPSGIYIIVAYDAEGSNVATTKLAVIRE